MTPRPHRHQPNHRRGRVRRGDRGVVVGGGTSGPYALVLAATVVLGSALPAEAAPGSLRSASAGAGSGCTSLTVRVGPSRVAGGRHAQVLVFTNSGRARCVLPAEFPGVRRAPRIPGARLTHGDSYFGGSARPRTLSLAPQQAASLILEWAQGPVGSDSPRCAATGSSALAIRAVNAPERVIHLFIDACGSRQLRETALVLGRTAGVGR